MTRVEQQIFSDADAVAKAAAESLLKKLSSLLESNPVVHIALTGGTVGILTLERLAEEDSASVDWSRVQIWWGDERFVAGDSADRNAQQARKAWLNISSVPAETIHEFPSSETGSLESAAEIFDAQLQSFWGESLPRFDLILLGVGPDGHVASLFPDHREKIPHRFTVIESNSPKPPAMRLSLSYEILNNADEVWFTVAGKDKAEAVAAAMSGDVRLPVAKVRAKLNRWFVDQAAAGAI